MATATSDYDYHCDIYEPEDIVDGNDLVSSRDRAVLFIDFYVSVDGFLKYDYLTLPIDEITLWSVIICAKLSHLYVPIRSQITLIPTIASYARNIITHDRIRNCDVIPMVVMITAVNHNQQQQEEEAISRAVTLSINGEALNMMPASESSIAALEKTRVEDCPRHCVVCLEEISVGSEAARMPCSHVFHQDCIFSWLKQSNLCPLCRFQMPPGC